MTVRVRPYDDADEPGAMDPRPRAPQMREQAAEGERLHESPGLLDEPRVGTRGLLEGGP